MPRLRLIRETTGAALTAVVMLSGAVSAGVAGAQTPRASVFGPANHFSVGAPRPFGISWPAADLNGDGSVDLAVTTEGTATEPASGVLVIMANNGSGSFAPAGSYPLLLPSDIGPPPARSIGRGVASVDVTGDNRADVLVVDAGKPQFAAGDVPGFLLVYRNEGGGQFTRLPAMTVGRRPLGMALADYNGDNRLDIGIDLEDADGLQMLRGNGDGTFSIAQTREVPCDSPHFPSAGDFNEDGRADLLIPCNNNGPVFLFPGNGNGTVGAPITVASPPSVARPHVLTVADFDGQHLDFAVANTGPVGGRVTVHLGNGQGGFFEDPGSPYPGTPGGSTAFVKAANITGNPDLTADARPDVLYTSGNQGVPNYLVLLERKGNAFDQAVGSPYLTGTTLLREVTVADLNGDGQIDAAAVERPASATAPGTIAVLLHNPPVPNRTLSGSINGPVVVASGEVVRLTDARVAGRVTVNPGGALVVERSFVAGGIVADDPTFLSVCGSTVSASARDPSQGVLVQNATVPVRIGDPARGCAANRISGSVRLTGNQLGLTLGANLVSGSVAVSNNTFDTAILKANRISGTLSCTGNAPPPSNAGQPNSARAKTGQCATL